MVTTGFSPACGKDSGFRRLLWNLIPALPLCCLLVAGIIKAQMPANTPVFPVNAKWVTDKGSQVYNVMAYNADNTGSTCTDAAIQSVLDLFTNGLPYPGAGGTVNGTIYFPPGHYKICNYLWYMGGASSSLRIQGAAGLGSGATGSVIDYYGPASNLGAFIVMGAGNLVVDSIAINVRGLAQYGIWTAATNTINTTLGTAVSPGTQTVTPANMCTSGPGGTGCIGVGSLLNIDSGVNNVEFVNVTATGGGSPPTTFTATFQKSHASTAVVGHSFSASNTRFHNVTVYGLSGASASGVAIGSPVGGQDDTIDFDDCDFTASGTGANTPLAAIQLIYGFNYMHYTVHGGSWYGFQYGWYGQNAGQLTIDETVFLDITNSLVWNAGDALTMYDTHAEQGTGAFLTGGLVGNATLIGNDWRTTLSNTNDIVISWQGSLVLLNNRFWNQRTSSSVPKVNAGSQILYVTNPVFSSGNFFANVPAGYAPFTDYLGNPVLPTNNNSLGAYGITSINDMGDCASTGYPSCILKSIVPVSFLASENSANIAGSGVLNVGDTECAVSFRNHASNADVPGICKNTSDVVLLGGMPGVSASQYSTTVATGTPPLSVASTTPVANLTVQNCDTCNITTSMTVGGGTALHAMNLYNTASITPTAVTPSSCSDQTFVVSGLLATDRVSSIAPPSALGNLSLSGYASAANTVLFHFCNPSSSPVTPPAGVYSFLAVH
jgi:hypothetical protein